jgi:23S rRNA (cytosine1962-C5)-methyltransferase
MITNLKLKQGRDKSLLRFHPWVFSGALLTIPQNLVNGSPVKVLNHQNEFIAYGYFGTGSISVRVLSFLEQDNILSDEFWENAISAAYTKRKALNFDNNTNCFRLVHGEGDSLPGLILDYYNGVVIFQAHNTGIYLFKDYIVRALQNILQDKLKAIFHKPKEVSKTDEIPDIGFWYGSAEPSVVLENKFEFEVDWMDGQKTGFFIDQRESRALIARYASNKSVLNTFSYTGGFSIYAAAANATKVVSVDISAPAIEACRKNLIRNGLESFAEDCIVADSFNTLKEIGSDFDILVLDPPSFAKSFKNSKQATKGYRRLNLLAFKYMKKGSILFTFSCTQVVNRKLFEDTVFAAAVESGRKVSILHRLGQPADHPINLFHPETEYLKGLVLYVE